MTPSDEPLNRDLACCRCGYNLRGLPLSHCCPECACSAFESAASDAYNFSGEGTRWKSRKTSWQASEELAAVIGCSAQAVRLVLAAVIWTCEEARLRRPLHKRLFSRADPIGPEEVCLGFRRYAERVFGGTKRAKEMLRTRGVNTSADLGKIVQGLAAARLIVSSSGPADFERLFSIDDWA